MKLQDLLDALQEAGIENVDEVLSSLVKEINDYLGEQENEDEKMKKVFGI